MLTFFRRLRRYGLEETNTTQHIHGGTIEPDRRRVSHVFGQTECCLWPQGAKDSLRFASVCFKNASSEPLLTIGRAPM